LESKDVGSLKPRIQILSDLIFGLALSIGAIVLIGKQPEDAFQVLFFLGVFGFGFLILITVWYRYSTLMSSLPVETSGLIILNMLLLFLVAIEPYLLNLLLLSGNLSIVGNLISDLYALDLGTIFLILTYFTHKLIAEKKKVMNAEWIKNNKMHRNLLLSVAILFFVSMLPIFWSTKVYGISIQFLLWFAFFPTHTVFRIAMSRKEKTHKA
jgi:uncharacterized membrane protein